MFLNKSSLSTVNYPCWLTEGIDIIHTNAITKISKIISLVSPIKSNRPSIRNLIRKCGRFARRECRDMVLSIIERNQMTTEVLMWYGN